MLTTPFLCSDAQIAVDVGLPTVAELAKSDFRPAVCSDSTGIVCSPRLRGGDEEGVSSPVPGLIVEVT